MSESTHPVQPVRPPRPSGRHPVNVGHLVMGVAFLGLTIVWALVATDAVRLEESNWLLPLPWLAAGAAGLLATVFRRRPVHDEPSYDARVGEWSEDWRQELRASKQQWKDDLRRSKQEWKAEVRRANDAWRDDVRRQARTRSGPSGSGGQPGASEVNEVNDTGDVSGNADGP